VHRFLFITHLTPAAKRSPLRQSLFEIYLEGLKRQQYEHWKVLLLGEEEKEDGRFKYVRLGGETREEKFEELRKLYSRADVKALTDEAQYIVKLDDDDLISPGILQMLSEKDFDCYYDSWHTFYDVSSGITTQQQRPWIASTCVHKKEHALASYEGPGASPLNNLLYSDHSKAWHAYYAGKKIIAAEKTHPVYLRVLSPTSITASSTNRAPMRIEEVDLKKYYAYLRGFGYWEKSGAKGFEAYYPLLAKAWEDFANFGQRSIPGIGRLNRIAGRLGRLWKRT